MIHTLNTDFLDATPIILPNYQQVAFYLVGCGGTGSWLATTICRLARLLNHRGQTTQVTFIDPDLVEAVNISRQNFSELEIGLNKAQTLALRSSLAWGLEIQAIASEFQPQIVASSLLYSSETTLTLLIGCVDNAAARQTIAKTLTSYQSPTYQATRLWWLDCGNHATSGQVLLGSHLETEPTIYQFHELGCVRLPAPTIQHPELLIVKPEEQQQTALSCAELAMANAQSLGINQMVAAYSSEYLIQLLTGKLKRFATYFDLPSGAAQSYYTTQANVLQVIQSKVSGLVNIA